VKRNLAPEWRKYRRPIGEKRTCRTRGGKKGKKGSAGFARAVHLRHLHKQGGSEFIPKKRSPSIHAERGRDDARNSKTFQRGGNSKKEVPVHIQRERGTSTARSQKGEELDDSGGAGIAVTMRGGGERKRKEEKEFLTGPRRKKKAAHADAGRKKKKGGQQAH